MLDVNALLQVNGHHGNGRPSVRDRELAAQIVQELRDENGVLRGQLDRLIQENAELRERGPDTCTGCAFHGKATTVCKNCLRVSYDNYRPETGMAGAPDPDKQHNPCNTCARNPIKCGNYEACEKKRRYEAARNERRKGAGE